ncbi:hypothetical protein [Erythrobacter tepidarius]|uniref:hypothetical protein n=1 Tax=Erythrobacter tepidarius TaxID=60454 RepID=UPI0011815F17|nr:hypothetical protein [Erythrobacter tepidarius]
MMLLLNPRPSGLPVRLAGSFGAGGGHGKRSPFLGLRCISAATATAAPEQSVSASALRGREVSLISDRRSEILPCDPGFSSAPDRHFHLIGQSGDSRKSR